MVGENSLKVLMNPLSKFFVKSKTVWCLVISITRYLLFSFLVFGYYNI